jgi:hypothetical protein
MRVDLVPRILFLLKRNNLTVIYFFAHLVFLLFLGKSFAFSSDEGGYLYTFSNLYGSDLDPNPQYGSGWIAAPKWFLQVVYVPAKILSLVGFPDFLSIRLLSAFFATYCVWLLLSLIKDQEENKKFAKFVIVSSFCIPSIFLWTSLGLRESFIILELVLVLKGMHVLFTYESNLRAQLYISLGAFGLLCTKAYLWVIVVLSVVVLCLFYLVLRKSNWKRISLQSLLSSLIIPLAIFSLSSSSYALSFLLQSDIAAVSSRSGDSIAQVSVDVPTTSATQTPTTSATQTPTTSATQTPTTSATQTPTTSATQKVLTFHGDYSLILIHDYLKTNPNSIFTRVLRLFGIEGVIQQKWDSKVATGISSKSGKVGTTEISFNSHQLQPGSISNPFSVIRPAILFLFGPIPFVGNPGFAASVASFESPLWWILILLVASNLLRLPIRRSLQNPSIMFPLILFIGFVIFSAIVEVNLGTSFRHRSIVLPALLFVYLESRSQRLSKSLASEKNTKTSE